MRARERGGAALPAQLLRLHRGGRSSLLVLGGTAADRVAFVREFHDNSAMRHRSLVIVNCAAGDDALRGALCAWLGLPLAPAAPLLDDPAPGTLYLESVGRLSSAAQKLLLALAHQIDREGAWTPAERGPHRIACGDDPRLFDLVARREFDPALFDALDKVRAELGSSRRRGAA